MLKNLKLQKTTILSFVATVGVISTTATAIVATPKAVKLLKAKKKELKTDNLSKIEIIKITWKCYIPTIIIGATTIVCIFSIDTLNKNQQALLTSSYNLLKDRYDAYIDKVKEIHGQDAHDKIVEAIAKEECKDVVISAESICANTSLDVDEGSEPEVIRTFYDVYSKRYFEASLSKVLQAQYHLNRNFSIGGEVNINQFYDFLGLSHIENGDELGFDLYDGIYWIDFNNKFVKLDDDMEVIFIEMLFEPWLLNTPEIQGVL